MSGRDKYAETSAESRLRVQTSVRLRWFAVAGQALTVLIVAFGFGFELPIGWCLLVIAASAWLNVYLRMRFSGGHRLSIALATGLLAYDILQLAVLLFLTGGLQNPFIVLLVAPVTVSAATLPPRSTLLLGGLALAVTVTLAFTYLPLPWYTGEHFQLPFIYKIGLFSAVLACLVFLALYAWRLAKEARDMSAALAATELVLAREQRLHALDGLAAAAAHELGTPLATIVLVANEMQREVVGRPDLKEDLELLKSEARRCREILQKLTRAPTEKDPMHAAMTIGEVAEEAAAPHLDRGKQIEIVNTSDGVPPEIERSPGVLFGVGNLIENASDFAESKVRIELAWDSETVAITIKDDGPGFSTAVLDNIGNPYVTSRLRGRARGTGGGLGLGVFIAKTLLERSGAALEVSNRSAPETGAIVRIVWPRARFEVDRSDGTSWSPFRSVSRALEGAGA